MFALHWICALTLALASCLCAQPVKRDIELLSYISELISFIPANCPDDVRLYSPFDIKKECVSSALNCSIAELDVLAAECDFSEDEKDVIYTVNTIIKTKKPTIPSESCRCEMYEEKDVKTFLDNLQRQMQQLNSLV